MTFSHFLTVWRALQEPISIVPLRGAQTNSRKTQHEDSMISRYIIDETPVKI